MDTMDRKLVTHVSKAEAIAYCHAHRERFIELAPNAKDGEAEFNFLIDGLASGEFEAADVTDYGMSDQELR